MDSHPPRDIRREAEDRVSRSTGKKPVETDGMQRTVHELQVHQVELELQNEELRTTHAALEESRAKYADLYDFAPIGFFSFDQEGLISDLNIAGALLLGLDREWLRRKPFSLFVSHGDQHAFSDHLSTAFHTRARTVDEFRVVPKGPPQAPQPPFYARLESQAGTDAFTGQPVCRTALIDITSRVRAETALKESEERFRLLVTDVKDYAIFLLDPEGRIISWNVGAERVTGYSEPEIIGRSLVVLCDHEVRQPGGLDSTLQAALQDGQADITCWIVCKNGSRIWATVSLAKLTGHLQTLGLSVVLHDLSEQRQVEEERLKTSRLESVALLAGGIAHDFNNLLTTVVGNLSLARLSIESKETVLARLEEGEKACARAKSLTQQLLTFATGGAPVRSMVAMGPLLNEWVTFSLRGSTIRPTIEIAPDLWLAEVDSAQISQVINNMVINAQQAMSASGGSIHVTAQNLTLRRGKSDLPPGPYLKISVADTGPGIPGEHLSKIFDPFFTTKAHGTGLGLTTAYSIVKRHQGKVEVHSSRKGTTFDIYLPAVPSVAPPTQGSAPGALTKGRGTILVMDDDATICDVFVPLAEKLGYHAECVADGMTALARYREAREAGQPFDLVILDLTIPGGMGGVETMPKLRELDPLVKGLVSSGYSNDPVLGNYREYGFCGVLSKPYSVEELSATLGQLLPASRTS